MARVSSIRGRVGVLLLAGLLVAVACRVAHSQAAGPAAPTALATAYVPPDAIFAVLIRPAELAVPEVMQPVVDAVDEMLKPARLGISVADIDEFKFVFLGLRDTMRGMPDLYMAIRANRAVDWKKVFDVMGQQEQEFNGHKFYTRGADAVWFPDDRTIVVGSREAVERTTQSPDPNDRAAWSERWEKAAKSPLAGFMHAKMLPVMRLPGPDGRPDKALLTVGEDASYGVLEGHVTDKGFAVMATIHTNSKEASVRVAPIVSGALANLGSMILTQSRLAAEPADRLTEQLASLLAGTQVVTDGQTVEIKALLTPKMIEVFAASAQLMAGR